MKESFLRRRVAIPLLNLLRQGVTPEKLALSLALSATFSVIPAFGGGVWLCTLFAVAFGLNLPVMQAVNYLMYPAQIALLLPFFRLGEKLFRAPHLPISVSQIYAMVHLSWWEVTKFLWSTTWHALVVWGMLAPFAVALIYGVLTPIFRRIAPKAKQSLSVAEGKAA
jgi:uncharacterized protein (DUF2062 family)